MRWNEFFYDYMTDRLIDNHVMTGSSITYGAENGDISNGNDGVNPSNQVIWDNPYLGKPYPLYSREQGTNSLCEFSLHNKTPNNLYSGCRITWKDYASWIADILNPKIETESYPLPYGLDIAWYRSIGFNFATTSAALPSGYTQLESQHFAAIPNNYPDEGLQFDPFCGFYIYGLGPDYIGLRAANGIYPIPSHVNPIAVGASNDLTSPALSDATNNSLWCELSRNLWNDVKNVFSPGSITVIARAASLHIPAYPTPRNSLCVGSGFGSYDIRIKSAYNCTITVTVEKRTYPSSTWSTVYTATQSAAPGDICIFSDASINSLLHPPLSDEWNDVRITGSAFVYDSGIGNIDLTTQIIFASIGMDVSPSDYYNNVVNVMLWPRLDIPPMWTVRSRERVIPGGLPTAVIAQFTA